MKSTIANTFDPLPPILISVASQVVDHEGYPLLANIIISGTSIGTMTDLDGYFRLENVPMNETLDISFQGEIRKVEVSNIPQKIVFDTTNQLDVVVINAPKKSYAWLGYSALVAAAIYLATKKSKPVKITI
jgi:hypothetical protein